MAVWDDDGPSALLISSVEQLHTPQTPMLLGSEGIANCVTAVTAAGSIGHHAEKPAASEAHLQPKQSRGAIKEALGGEKPRRLQAIDVGGMVMDRSVTRRRSDSVYNSLAPSSRATRQQLTDANEHLCKRLATSQKGKNSTSQHLSDSGISTGDASPMVCGGSSTSLPSGTGAGAHATENSSDTDLAVAASGGAAGGLRGPSAVTLQPLGALRESPLHECEGHVDGKGGSPPSFNGAKDNADAAEAGAAPRVPKPGSSDHPSCPQSPGSSLALSSHSTGIETAKPPFKSSSTRRQRRQSMGSVVSFRRSSGSRNSRAESMPSISVTYVDDVGGAHERHRPIRRKSSSCEPSIVWIFPPLTECLRSNRMRSAKGNSTLSSDTPSAGTSVAEARVPGVPCRPPSVTSQHTGQKPPRAHPVHSGTSSVSAHPRERNGGERQAGQRGLSDTCASFTHVGEPAPAPSSEGRLTGRAESSSHGDTDGHRLPLRGQAPRLREVAAQKGPSSSPRHEALRAVAPALEEVLQRSSANVVEQANPSPVEASHSPRKACSRRDDRWIAASAPPSAFASSTVSASPQHLYYEAGQQQAVPCRHPYGAEHHGESQTRHAREGPNTSVHGRAEGFHPLPRRAKTSHVRPVGGLNANKLRASLPTAKCCAVVELLSPVVPVNPRPAKSYWKRSVKKPSGESQPQRTGLPDIVENVASTQKAHRRTTAAAEDQARGSVYRKRKRLLRKKRAYQIAQLHRSLAPYMESLRTGSRARASVHASQRKKNGKKRRAQQHRENSYAQGPQPIDYAALATQHDPLEDILRRHGFWGEAMRRL
ncbi:hypothetical protein, unknown function [Leishmania tarentolae]|uniref:Uncharacterized protein n=1 Tax=Leishmania tarentolae TaxID=5689 RepID=A0A640KUI3_LEITA|nr:hypothetical protein, unknown function [Leishmania tarentolae]